MNGYILVFISALLYGVEPTLLEYALRQGLTAAQTSLIAAIFGCVMYGAACLVARARFRVRGGQLVKMLLLGALMSATNILLASSYNWIPVGCATVIHFIYPTLVCLTTVLFFGGRLSGFRVVAIGLSIAGLIMISGGAIAGSAEGVWLAILSSVTYASYILLTERMETVSSLPIWTRMFYIGIGNMLTATICVLNDPEPGGITPASVGIVLICSVMLAVGVVAFALGVDRIGGTSAAFFSLFEPLTSMIVSTLVYHYGFTWQAFVGCAAILLSVICVSLSDRQEDRRRTKA